MDNLLQECVVESTYAQARNVYGLLGDSPSLFRLAFIGAFSIHQALSQVFWNINCCHLTLLERHFHRFPAEMGGSEAEQLASGPIQIEPRFKSSWQ